MIRTGEAYRQSIRDGRAVYNNFDFSGPLDFVRKAARLSENVPR